MTTRIENLQRSSQLLKSVSHVSPTARNRVASACFAAPISQRGVRQDEQDKSLRLGRFAPQPRSDAVRVFDRTGSSQKLQPATVRAVNVAPRVEGARRIQASSSTRSVNVAPAPASCGTPKKIQPSSVRAIVDTNVAKRIPPSCSMRVPTADASQSDGRFEPSVRAVPLTVTPPHAEGVTPPNGSTPSSGGTPQSGLFRLNQVTMSPMRKPARCTTMVARACRRPLSVGRISKVTVEAVPLRVRGDSALDSNAKKFVRPFIPASPLVVPRPSSRRGSHSTNEPSYAASTAASISRSNEVILKRSDSKQRDLADTRQRHRIAPEGRPLDAKPLDGRASVVKKEGTPRQRPPPTQKAFDPSRTQKALDPSRTQKALDPSGTEKALDSPSTKKAFDPPPRPRLGMRRMTLTNLAIRGVVPTTVGPKSALVRRSGSTLACSRIRHDSEMETDSAQSSTPLASRQSRIPRDPSVPVAQARTMTSTQQTTVARETLTAASREGPVDAAVVSQTSPSVHVAASVSQGIPAFRAPRKTSEWFTGTRLNSASSAPSMRRHSVPSKSPVMQPGRVAADENSGDIPSKIPKYVPASATKSSAVDVSAGVKRKPMDAVPTSSNVVATAPTGPSKPVVSKAQDVDDAAAANSASSHVAAVPSRFPAFKEMPINKVKAPSKFTASAARTVDEVAVPSSRPQLPAASSPSAPFETRVLDKATVPSSTSSHVAAAPSKFQVSEARAVDASAVPSSASSQLPMTSSASPASETAVLDKVAVASSTSEHVTSAPSKFPVSEARAVDASAVPSSASSRLPVTSSASPASETAVLDKVAVASSTSEHVTSAPSKFPVSEARAVGASAVPSSASSRLPVTSSASLASETAVLDKVAVASSTSEHVASAPSKFPVSEARAVDASAVPSSASSRLPPASETSVLDKVAVPSSPSSHVAAAPSKFPVSEARAVGVSAVPSSASSRLPVTSSASPASETAVLDKVAVASSTSALVAAAPSEVPVSEARAIGASAVPSSASSQLPLTSSASPASETAVLDKVAGATSTSSHIAAAPSEVPVSEARAVDTGAVANSTSLHVAAAQSEVPAIEARTVDEVAVASPTKSPAVAARSIPRTFDARTVEAVNFPRSASSQGTSARTKSPVLEARESVRRSPVPAHRHSDPSKYLRGRELSCTSTDGVGEKNASFSISTDLDGSLLRESIASPLGRYGAGALVSDSPDSAKSEEVPAPSIPESVPVYHLTPETPGVIPSELSSPESAPVCAITQEAPSAALSTSPSPVSEPACPMTPQTAGAPQSASPIPESVPVCPLTPEVASVGGEALTNQNAHGDTLSEWYAEGQEIAADAPCSADFDADEDAQLELAKEAEGPSQSTAPSRSGDASPNELGSIDPAVWKFMESRYKQTGLWAVSKSHPYASSEEMKVLTEILDREWDSGEFDWHENPEELETNVRYALRYGGDQVCVVVGDIFCQGMNKFVTLKREGTSVTVFWPFSLKLQSNLQKMF